MNVPYTFPVGIQSSWGQPNDFEINNLLLKSWILDTGSLTEKLQSECQTFYLTLIGQRQAEITLEEFAQVRTNKQPFAQEDWQVREVLLWGDGQPWVFARSIIPQRLCQQDFADLNTQPLGQLIFNDKRFKRMPFQITHMLNPQPFYQQLSLSADMDLWGRRSVFGFEELKMMVCEIFLPDSPAYKTGT